ncbi:MAG: hypothetical protein M0D53_12720 [Flavobacterium sp. JAD_PAG50586_2]|nr:MAG: hypothetical protein M0D53_12720 [Flavobacterium sp. JAD_PAG50586_2]
MEEIKTFIENYIKDEYNANKSKTDVNVADDVYKDLALKAYSYYCPTVSNIFGRGTTQEKMKGLSEMFQKAYANNVVKAVPRTLFQIKHYKNSKLGDGLARFVTGEDMYACYVSYTENTGRLLGYNQLYYVAQTDEGLKIIYSLTYGVNDLKWRHSHDLETTQVLTSGQLIAVEKYQEPEEESSLKDYNGEK